MNTQLPIGLSDHLTHRANLKHTRYGWLRLTPAYSVHLVSDLLNQSANVDSVVLDPFCGTGTTALVCAERGISADTTDINPFLIWLATAKTRTYQSEDVCKAMEAACEIAESIRAVEREACWVPPLHQIEKWWDTQTLSALGRAMCAIKSMLLCLPTQSVDLLKLAFCRVMIESSNASFGHQSMSFKKNAGPELPYADEERVASSWLAAVHTICEGARSTIVLSPGIALCDARRLSSGLSRNRYTCVITSPPYPNRMSYIRELRPYMYWLGYLEDGRTAGELDWEAIGGTWGCATSNVSKWVPGLECPVPFVGFDNIMADIAVSSNTLSRYVHKYFQDMTQHIEELFHVVHQDGVVHYIVGNSKFYDVLLPVESIFASLFQAAGFSGVTVKPIRKRTSKKELYEYVVSAVKP